MKTQNQAILANINRIPATTPTIAPVNASFAPSTMPNMMDFMKTKLAPMVADGQYLASLRTYGLVPGVTADKMKMSMTWLIKTETGSQELPPITLSMLQLMRFIEQARLVFKATAEIDPEDLFCMVMAAPLSIWLSRTGVFQNVDLIPPYTRATNATPPVNTAPAPF